MNADETLRLFRAAAPGVAGVVLASDDGRPWAHDLATDPAPLVAQAARGPGVGTLVPSGESLYLVVFLPPEP